MLKLYIDTMNRLNSLNDAAINRASRKTDESGFASAETIALAVAGVLIVGGIYQVFKGNLLSAMTDIFGKMSLWSSN